MTYLDVEAVIDEQDDLRRSGRAAIASQLLGVGQFRSRAAAQCNREFSTLDRIAVCVGVRTGRKRCRVVQEAPRPGNNALAAFRVVSFSRRPVVRLSEWRPSRRGHRKSEPHRAFAALSA